MSRSLTVEDFKPGDRVRVNSNYWTAEFGPGDIGIVDPDAAWPNEKGRKEKGRKGLKSRQQIEQERMAEGTPVVWVRREDGVLSYFIGVKDLEHWPVRVECPECGNPFPLEDHYLCSECRDA